MRRMGGFYPRGTAYLAKVRMTGVDSRPALMGKRGFARPKEVLGRGLRPAQEAAPPTPKGKGGRLWRYDHALYPALCEVARVGAVRTSGLLYTTLLRRRRGLLRNL